MNKKSTLSSELHELNYGIEIARTVPSLDYEKVIQQQQDLIKKLQRQNHSLREYLMVVAGFENNSTQSTSSPQKGIKYLLGQIMKIVQVKLPNEILTKLRILQEKANKKLQPVFVERIKEKQVPVIVQKVKEVEVVKEVEKIVYVKENKFQKFLQTSSQNPIFSSKYHKSNYFESQPSKWKQQNETAETRRNDKTLKYKEKY